MPRELGPLAATREACVLQQTPIAAKKKKKKVMVQLGENITLQIPVTEKASKEGNK